MEQATLGAHLPRGELMEPVTLGALHSAGERIRRARRDCVFLHALTTASPQDVHLFLSRQCDLIVDDVFRGVICRVEGATCGNILRRLSQVEHLQHLEPEQVQDAWSDFLGGEKASSSLVAFADAALRATEDECARAQEVMSTGTYSDYSDYSDSHDDGSSSPE